ncbi:MAG: respiratory nitrate reductase subunit gamma [Flavobacteriales bacterium]|nr:respiratory nitrate reductase subunit gamma [Flavobacteriales bacterium]
MFDRFIFIALPYAALALFIVGTIYRYRSRGYTVSSISSQFLEGKKLFWGSQPFHWGILFLFFGHLIAFLFPRTILAWNGSPMRLLILEVSSFAFGLCALFGLSMLIYRRLTTRRVQIVTSKMDMVVFGLLLTQLITGLFVAYFSRWGSSWFASIVSPYLKSIFLFDPQTDAMVNACTNSMSLYFHVIGAFLIIALVPFTRFIHFLVYPIQYAWRSYQQVIWNWDRKKIRTTTEPSPGKPSRNN